ncbi:MAG: SpoIID/LytB domain-containing protein [Vampirovibrio sp.]|nr:SpoIID/LytB domain-containing protein [Vampirovibrio sp.]
MLFPSISIGRTESLKHGILAIFSIVLLGSTIAWCMNTPPQQLTPINASLIRVGISDDAMTAQEYPSTTIGATGAFTLKGLKSNTLYFEGNATAKVAIMATATGFQLTPKQETTSTEPDFSAESDGVEIVQKAVTMANIAVTEDLVLTADDPQTSFPIVYNITRKGKMPQYRGALQILKSAKSTPKKPLLFVVNVLDINDYLRAVVPNELPIRFGVEAVKAQAVAARNYAVRPREKNWQAFDICDSQYCQAYYGQQTETPETDTLLQATQGLIALSEGQPILALYSSSHGGVAEAYPNAFSDPKTGAFPAPQTYPYLTVNPDNETAVIPYEPLSNPANLRAYLNNTELNSFDVKAPHHRWSRTWSKAELEGVLNTTIPQLQANGLTKKFIQVAWKNPTCTTPFILGSLEKITVLQYGLAGKAMKLQIETSEATITLQKEFTIRKAFTKEGKALPSATIVFSHLTSPATATTPTQLTGITVDGAGFGHGVGMSQFGASRMSELGFSFDKIIQHYYPNTTLGTLPLEAKRDVPLQLNFATLKGQKAWLHLQLKQSFTALKSPLKLTLNNRPIELKPFMGKHRLYGVSSFLSGEHNQLIVNRHPQAGDFTLWISYEAL